MVQNEKVTLVCPDCGHEQDYRPKKPLSEMKNSRRKDCVFCPRSFKVKDNVKGQRGRKSKEERELEDDKPTGFFKYRKQD